MYTDFSVAMFVGVFCDHFCALTLYACTENMANQEQAQKHSQKNTASGHI
jgi:hypothetical protein